jgi:hypothetical protein
MAGSTGERGTPPPVVRLLARHSQGRTFQNNFYDQTVSKVRPHLVILIHWDNFFLPLSEYLEVSDKASDNLPAGSNSLMPVRSPVTGGNDGRALGARPGGGFG